MSEDRVPYSTRQYRERAAAGLCPSCGLARPAPRRTQCSRCIVRRRRPARPPRGFLRRLADAQLPGRRCGDCKQKRLDVRGLAPRCEPCRERFNAGRRKPAFATAGPTCAVVAQDAQEGQSRGGNNPKVEMADWGHATGFSDGLEV